MSTASRPHAFMAETIRSMTALASIYFSPVPDGTSIVDFP
jgi:hypothetical protein